MVPSLLLYRYLLLFPSEDEPAASLEPEIVQLLPSVQTEFASLLFPSKAAFLLSDFPENKNYKFTDITDFFLNMKIGEKTLSGIWQEVVSITDDIGMIDFTETSEENFGVNGSSVRRYTD